MKPRRGALNGRASICPGSSQKLTPCEHGGVRMMKVLRLTRLLRFFSDLRLMVSSIVQSCSSLTWALILLGAMMYLFLYLCIYYTNQTYLMNRTNPNRTNRKGTNRTYRMHRTSPNRTNRNRSRTEPLRTAVTNEWMRM